MQGVQEVSRASSTQSQAHFSLSLVLLLLDILNAKPLPLLSDCRMISMGQGQEVPARRLMNQMMHQGGWVLLQNCHLSLDYVVELMDQIVEQDHINENFRLWVTTESHPKFPITFLQVL